MTLSRRDVDVAIYRRQAADCTRRGRQAGRAAAVVLLVTAVVWVLVSPLAALGPAWLAAMFWGLSRRLHGRASGILHALAREPSEEEGA